MKKAKVYGESPIQEIVISEINQRKIYLNARRVSPTYKIKLSLPSELWD